MRVQGTLSGNGTVNGPVDQPMADVALSLKQGKLGTDSLSLDGRLLTGPDGFQVRSLSAAYLAHRLTGGEGSLDLRKGTFGFKGQFQTEVFSDTIGVALGLSGSYTPSAAIPTAARLFDLGLQGKLSLSGIKVAGTDMPSWAIAFRTAAGRISFDGGPGNSMHGWIDPQLAFAATLQDPLPITGNIQGRVIAGPHPCRVRCRKLRPPGPEHHPQEPCAEYRQRPDSRDSLHGRRGLGPACR